MTKPLLAGARNFRDVGGHRTADGCVVRYGLVFRSGHLADLTPADITTLDSMQIKTVVDFRPQREQELSGRDVVLHNVNYVSIPIGDPAVAPHVYRALKNGEFSALPDLATANRMVIREFADELGRALRLISDPENLPLVFHCIGGKDRTGLTAALLLSILGVPWPDVVKDYLGSNGRLGSTTEDQNAFLSKLVDRSGAGEITEANRLALRRFFVLEDSYLEAAWNEIGEVAPSWDHYMSEHLGVDHEAAARLRAMLLDCDSAGSG